MNNEGIGGLVLGIIGCAFAFISLIVCGWLGFVGMLCGSLGLSISKGRTSAVVCGLIALIGGAITGIIWAIAVNQLL